MPRLSLWGHIVLYKKDTQTNNMQTINIPAQDTRKWSINHKSDILGNVFASKNIDFDISKGKLKLSRRLVNLFDSAETTAEVGDTDLLLPVKFIRTNADTTDRWWAVTQDVPGVAASGLLFKTSNNQANGTWAQDAIANTPTDAMYDAEIFGQANNYDRLVVARDDDLAMMNNGTWTASWWKTTLSGTALSTSHPHQLHRVSNLLLIADGNKLHAIDDSLVKKESRITLPPEFRIIWITDDGYTVYIGTENLRNGEAYVFPWKNINLGGSETYDEPIPVYDDISFCGKVKDGILYIVNSMGQFMGYNGKAFEELDVFPMFNVQGINWADNRSPRSLISPNGIDIVDGQIHMSVNAMVNYDIANTLPEMLSGVWVYSDNIGLNHKFSFNTLRSSDGLQDFGQGYVAYTGALKETERGQGKFVAGVGLYATQSSTITKSIQVSSNQTSYNLTASQIGYIITQEIQSADMRAHWTRVKARIEKILNTSSFVALKYRIDKKSTVDTYPVTTYAYPHIKRFNWINSTTIDEVAAGEWNTTLLEVGDELEIIQGKQGGWIAHIATISVGGGVGGVDRMTLDSAVPLHVASSSGYFMAQNFKKLGTITDTSIQQQLFNILKRSQWIQFKVVMRGNETGPELHDLLLELETSKR